MLILRLLRSRTQPSFLVSGYGVRRLLLFVAADESCEAAFEREAVVNTEHAVCLINRGC